MVVGAFECSKVRKCCVVFMLNVVKCRVCEGKRDKECASECRVEFFFDVAGDAFENAAFAGLFHNGKAEEDFVQCVRDGAQFFRVCISNFDFVIACFVQRRENPADDAWCEAANVRCCFAYRLLVGLCANNKFMAVFFNVKFLAFLDAVFADPGAGKGNDGCFAGKKDDFSFHWIN